MKEQVKNQHWSDFEEAGAYWGLKTLAGIYSLAGRRACLIAMFPVLVIFYLFRTSSRTSIREFLTLRAKRQGLQAPGYWAGFKNFLAFGGAALDKLSAWNGDIRRDQVLMPGHMKSLFELDPDKKGAILFVSHLGNVEVIRALSSLGQMRPITVLVHTKHAQRFNKLMTRFNPESQLRLVEVTEVGPDIAAMLKDNVERGEWVVIAADRPPINGRENVVWVPFLGKPAPFALGPYILAHILEKPVYMVASIRVGRQFSVRWTKLSDRVKLPRKTRNEAVEKLAHQYSNWLEALAVEYPEQWFNFFPFWAQPQD